MLETKNSIGSDGLEKFQTQLRGGFSRLMLVPFRKPNTFNVILFTAEISTFSLRFFFCWFLTWLILIHNAKHWF